MSVARVPAWLADFAEMIGGYQLTTSNAVTGLSIAERHAHLARIRERLSSAPANERYAMVVRWLLDDSAARVVAPGSGLTVSDFVTRRLNSENVAEVRVAALAASAEARVFARLSDLLRAQRIRKENDNNVRPEERADQEIAIAAYDRRARALDQPIQTAAKPPVGEKKPIEAEAEAQFEAGEALRTGNDLPGAARAYRRAADLGHAESQKQLGVMHAKGEGVPQSDTEAVAWYTKAASQGLPEAQYLLGVRLILGRGTAKDEQAGLDWYRKAAAQGYAEAVEALRQRGP